EDVAINWQIDDAGDVRYFEVERSFNGRDFIVLANITPQRSLEYVYLDYNAMLLNATMYYRIKAQLYNGETKYTAIQKVIFPSKLSVQIAPNPVTATVSLRGYAHKEEQIVLAIINSQGMKMHEEQWQRPQGVFSKSISMEKFPAGVYWIKLITKEGTSIERVIRQ
ncbi:MAG TPA: T9SS type A sorting domain-containing protein, partial [Flavisolibacter sp.]|nr:T9SS type A sorting domain-containing protein [Flavisolibacter sp.]